MTPLMIKLIEYSLKIRSYKSTTEYISGIIKWKLEIDIKFKSKGNPGMWSVTQYMTKQVNLPTLSLYLI